MFRLYCFDTSAEGNVGDLGWLGANQLNYPTFYKDKRHPNVVDLDWCHDSGRIRSGVGKIVTFKDYPAGIYLQAVAPFGVTVNRYLTLGDPVSGYSQRFAGWNLWTNDLTKPVNYDRETGIITNLWGDLGWDIWDNNRWAAWNGSHGLKCVEEPLPSIKLKLSRTEGGRRVEMGYLGLGGPGGIWAVPVSTKEAAVALEWHTVNGKEYLVEPGNIHFLHWSSQPGYPVACNTWNYANAWVMSGKNLVEADKSHTLSWYGDGWIYCNNAYPAIEVEIEQA
jgi:hypothetical protein